jgi:hypothetical protein
MSFGSPPGVDPAATTITGVSVKGSRSTVMTLEAPHPSLPQEWRYDLEREDGRWLLTNRRWLDDEDGRWHRNW